MLRLNRLLLLVLAWALCSPALAQDSLCIAEPGNLLEDDHAIFDHLSKGTARAEKVTTALSKRSSGETARKLAAASGKFGMAHRTLKKGAKGLGLARTVIRLGCAVECLETSEAGSAGFAIGAGHLFAAAGQLGEELPGLQLAKWYFKWLASSEGFFVNFQEQVSFCKRHPTECRAMCNDAQLMCAELVEQTLAPACETLRIGSDGSKVDPEPDVEAADSEAPAEPEGTLEEVRDRVKQRVDRAFADPVEQKMIRGLGSNPRAAQEEFEKRFDELIAARAAYSRYDLIERLTSDEAEAARAKLEEAVCAARRQLVGVSLALPSGQEEFESEDRALNAVQRCRTL